MQKKKRKIERLNLKNIENPWKGVWRNGSLVITSILFVKSKVRPECNALLRYDSYNHCEKYPKLATKSPREEKSLQESLGDSKRLLATFFKVPEIWATLTVISDTFRIDCKCYIVGAI